MSIWQQLLFHLKKKYKQSKLPQNNNRNNNNSKLAQNKSKKKCFIIAPARIIKNGVKNIKISCMLFGETLDFQC